MNIHINLSKPSEISIHRFNCLDCKKHAYAISFFQDFYGPQTTCLFCGREYIEGQKVPLDFLKGVRLKNKQAAKKHFRYLSSNNKSNSLSQNQV